MNTSHLAFGSRKSELLVEAVERFLNVVELWSTIKKPGRNRKRSECAQDTTEPVFFVEESVKITVAVFLFKGLLGSVEFPELIEKEQLDSVANFEYQFCMPVLKSEAVPASLQQCGLHLIPSAW